MKCVRCKEKKAKRGCEKEEGRLICSLCCAAIRDDDCAGCSFYRASQSYQRSKEIKAVRKKHFITKMMPDVDEQCDRALALIERGAFEEGSRRLETLIEDHPGYHTVLFSQGVCAAMSKRFGDAISYFKAAVDSFPLFVEAHFNLGNAYIQTLQIDEAVEAFRQVVEIDGRDGDLGRQAASRLDELDRISRKTDGLSLEEHAKIKRIYQQGTDALREKAFHRAVERFEEVLKRNEKHVQSYGNMGLAYAGLGDKAKAMACFDKALALHPEYEPALLNRQMLNRVEDTRTLLENSDTMTIEYYREKELLKRKTPNG